MILLCATVFCCVALLAGAKDAAFFIMLAAMALSVIR